MEKEKTTKTEVSEKDYLNEEVEITLMKDDGKYKDDVVVILNGTAIKVPRGVPVKIKRKYANIIKESMAENSKAVLKAASLATE